MKCITCNKEIVLRPSAAERASNGQHSAAYYIQLFTEHAECLTRRRNAEVVALMRRIAEKDNENGR